MALRGVASEIIYEEKKLIEHVILWVCEVKIINGEAREQDEGEVRFFDKNEIEKMKENIISSDYIMLKNFIFKDTSRLPLHKCRMRKNSGKYEVEYFGL